MWVRQTEGGRQEGHSGTGHGEGLELHSKRSKKKGGGRERDPGKVVRSRQAHVFKDKERRQTKEEMGERAMERGGRCI